MVGNCRRLGIASFMVDGNDEAMDNHANKALVRRFVEEVFEERRANAVNELVADSFTSHTWHFEEDGRSKLRAAAERLRFALDDVTFDVEDMIAEGDRVAVRLTASARQVGELMGMPPTGKSYSIGEIHIFRVEDGKIAEHWHHLDAPSMMAQLKGDAGES